MKKIVNELIADLAQASADNWGEMYQAELAEVVQRICRRALETARRRQREMYDYLGEGDKDELSYDYEGGEGK